MSLTLIVMRHAKSSWDTPGLSDHARPLNARGRRSAAALGDWLRQNAPTPDAVVLSSSRRTRETCAGLALDAPMTATDALYHAGAGTTLRTVQAMQAPCLLVIGHNPGLAEFAARLVRVAPPHPRFADFPTGATLVATAAVATWSDLAFGTMTATGFVVPRDLFEPEA